MKKILSLMPALVGVVAIVDSSFARENGFITNEASARVIADSFSVSGNLDVDYKTHYRILNDYGVVVAKGKTDSNGVFFTRVEKSKLDDTKNLILNYKGGSVTATVPVYSSSIIFDEKVVKQNFSPLLLGGADVQGLISGGFQFVYFLAAADSPWAIWSLISLGFTFFGGLFGEEKPDPMKIVNQKLGEALEKLDDIDTAFDTNVAKLNERFNTLGMSDARDAIKAFNGHNQDVKKQIKNINDRLSQDIYEDFLNKNGVPKDAESIEDAFAKSQDFWAEVDKYDDSVEYSKSVRAQIDEIYALTLGNEKYLLKDKATHADHDFKLMLDMSTQKTLENKLRSINSNTIQVSLDDDTGYMKNISDGDISDAIYMHYLRYLDDISNIRALNQIMLSDGSLITNGKDTEELKERAENAIKDVTEVMQGYMSRDGVDAWPNITYVPIIKNGTSYLFVVAPIDSYTKLDKTAQQLAVDISGDEFLPMQKKFFKTVLDGYWNGQTVEASYDDGQNNLIAYYPLKRSIGTISNRAIINPSNDDQPEIKSIDCNVNYCRVDLKNTSKSKYTLNFNNEAEFVIPQGTKVFFNHQFDIDANSWDSINGNEIGKFIAIKDEAGKLIANKDFKIYLPKTPQGAEVDKYITIDWGPDIEGGEASEFHDTSELGGRVITYNGLPLDFKVTNNSTARYVSSGDYSQLKLIDGNQVQFARYSSAKSGGGMVYRIEFDNDQVKQTLQFYCDDYYHNCGNYTWEDASIKNGTTKKERFSNSANYNNKLGEFNSLWVHKKWKRREGSAKYGVNYNRDNSFSSEKFSCPPGYLVPNAASVIEWNERPMLTNIGDAVNVLRLNSSEGLDGWTSDKYLVNTGEKIEYINENQKRQFFCVAEQGVELFIQQ